jgi:hypothetical protein
MDAACPKRRVSEMRHTLLALSTAIVLCGCNNVSASICSSDTTKTILQNTIQKNVADVFSLADPNDPFKFNIDTSDIVTLDEGPHKATCKILADLSNKANPPGLDANATITDDDWINYTVEKTDNNDKTYVTIFISPSLKEELRNARNNVELEKLEKEYEENKKEAAAKAVEEEKTSNTIDTSASCTSDERAVGFLKENARGYNVTNIVTISPGVCVAYLAYEIPAALKYTIDAGATLYNKLPYTIMMHGVKSTVNPDYPNWRIVNRDNGWSKTPFPGQIVR